MDTKVSTTSERLREVMEERKFKQVDILRRAQPICEKYGLKFPKSALSQYLAGTYEPDQNKLFILGSVLNVSEAWLMGYDVPKERDRGQAHESTSSLPTHKDIAYNWFNSEATKAERLEFMNHAMSIIMGEGK